MAATDDHSWSLTALNQSSSTAGRVVTLAVAPWVIGLVLLGNKSLPQAPVLVRVALVPVVFWPAIIWLLAQFFAETRWFRWFYRPVTRVWMTTGGIEWLAQGSSKVAVGPWSQIAGLVRRDLAVVLVDPADKVLSRVPGDVAWVRDPATNQTYTFAGAMATYRPHQFAVIQAFAGQPARLRLHRPGDAPIEVPVRVQPPVQRRRQAIVFLAIAIVAALVALTRG